VRREQAGTRNLLHAREASRAKEGPNRAMAADTLCQRRQRRKTGTRDKNADGKLAAVNRNSPW
jgi:hypothetical protein